MNTITGNATASASSLPNDAKLTWNMNLISTDKVKQKDLVGKQLSSVSLLLEQVELESEQEHSEEYLKDLCLQLLDEGLTFPMLTSSTTTQEDVARALLNYEVEEGVFVTSAVWEDIPNFNPSIT